MNGSRGKTVLFFGDSITHAHRMPSEVHNCYQLGSGYVNSVAAELDATDPQANHRFINRGECGNTVKDLLERCEVDCISMRPDLVSILIGVNDAGLPQCDPNIFRDTYLELLDRITTALPSTRLMILEPFGLAVTATPDLQSISVRQLGCLAALQPIVHQVAVSAASTFVPVQALFNSRAPETPEVWSADGIHPSAAGHWLIARAWVSAARAAGWF